MSFLIGFLTVLLVLDCIVLIFLVLMQLPKKESGTGLAFGAGAADALFGAGSGNVMTKMTKYAAIIFFSLTLLLGMANSKVYHNRSRLELPKDLAPATETAPATAPTPVTPVIPPPEVAPQPTPIPSTPPTMPPAQTPQS